MPLMVRPDHLRVIEHEDGEVSTVEFSIFAERSISIKGIHGDPFTVIKPIDNGDADSKIKESRYQVRISAPDAPAGRRLHRIRISAELDGRGLEAYVTIVVDRKSENSVWPAVVLESGYTQELLVRNGDRTFRAGSSEVKSLRTVVRPLLIAVSGLPTLRLMQLGE